MKDEHEDHKDVGVKKTGKKSAYFCFRRGEELELLVKIFTLEKPQAPFTTIGPY